MTDSHRDRLIAFALLGAATQHEWWFDPTENTDGLPPEGHEQPFASCPHVDCRLVREVTMKIPVPDVPHDSLCWKQKLDPPAAMGRCDRPRDHLGPHSWALADCLRDLDGLEVKTREEAGRWLDLRAADNRAYGKALTRCADELDRVLAPYRALLEP